MSPPTPRTTSDLVAAIIDVQNGFDVSPMIAAANMIVTGACSNSGYSDGFVGSQMELIERWLSAHIYSVYDRQDQAVGVGASRSTFQGQATFGLKSSFYGQMVTRLDFHGNLAALDNQAEIKLGKASIKQLGTNRGICDWSLWWFGFPYSDLTVCQ